MGHWVCKQNGEIQCQDNPPVSLKTARAQLAVIVGESNIVAEKVMEFPTIKMCGVPAGKFNAFELSDEGYDLLNTGFVGNGGFHDCAAHRHISRSASDESGFGAALALTRSTSVHGLPVSVRDLIGRRVRVYEQGAAVTFDWMPDRVNIVTKDQAIVDIWFG